MVPQKLNNSYIVSFFVENIRLKASHLKHLNISTESGKQLISVLSVRIHNQINHWIVDMLYLTISVFSTHDSHYFHGVVLILLAILKKRSQEKDKVFQCPCYFKINYLFL